MKRVRVARAVRAKVMAMGVVGNKEGNSKSGKGGGNGNRWQATKRVNARVARTIATAMTMKGNN